MTYPASVNTLNEKRMYDRTGLVIEDTPNLDEQFSVLNDTVNNLEINLTLAEFIRNNYITSPAPTEISIIPDTVGANPITTYYIIFQYKFIGNIKYHTAISEPIPVVFGDDTSSIILSAIPNLDFGGFFSVFKLENINDTYTSEYLTTPVDELSFPLDIFTLTNAGDDLSNYPYLYQYPMNFTIGQHYYISDKNWSLYAYSPTVLKSLKDPLHIFNGELLPIGIEPDILLIDTGIVDWDISTLTGIEFRLVIPKNYYPTNATVISNTNAITTFLVSSAGSIFSLNNLTSDENYLGITEAGGYSPSETLIISAIGVDSGNTLRSILKFHRSELSFPIPVPHIVSAETAIDGASINVICDYNMGLVNDGFSIYINGIDDSNGDNTISDKIINMLINGTISYGDIVTFSTNNNFKNTLGGLLSNVVNYPVVNNVPKP